MNKISVLFTKNVHLNFIPSLNSKIHPKKLHNKNCKIQLPKISRVSISH